MKIGLDLDGTLYSFPEFFIPFIKQMSAVGWQFFCTSSHARSEWEKDIIRLGKMGYEPDLIDPAMMYDHRHGDIKLKAKQADLLDMVFDDDGRVQQFTTTPIMCPPDIASKTYNFQLFC